MYDKVFLTGFRATGKTTVGKILAEKLNWSFYDLDFLITEEADQTVDQITENGQDWRRFREIENEVLEEISELKNIVVSCGGGVGVNDIKNEKTSKTFGELNREILKRSENSLIILLTLPEKIIEERLERQYKNKKIMPFLDSLNIKVDGLTEKELIKAQISDSMKAYKKRKTDYDKMTSFKIDSNYNNPSQVVAKIIEEIKK